MCRKCHSRLSKEKIVNDLKRSLEDPHFEEWNSTSLAFLSYSLAGEDGEEAQTLARELLEKYQNWNRQREVTINPKVQVELERIFGPSSCTIF